MSLEDAKWVSFRHGIYTFSPDDPKQFPDAEAYSLLGFCRFSDCNFLSLQRSDKKTENFFTKYASSY